MDLDPPYVNVCKACGWESHEGKAEIDAER
jgi:hypothetical protein